MSEPRKWVFTPHANCYFFHPIQFSLLPSHLLSLHFQMREIITVGTQLSWIFNLVLINDFTMIFNLESVCLTENRLDNSGSALVVIESALPNLNLKNSSSRDISLWAVIMWWCFLLWVSLHCAERLNKNPAVYRPPRSFKTFVDNSTELHSVISCQGQQWNVLCKLCLC